MKSKRVIYWTATTFVVCIMSTSGVLAVMHAPRMMNALAHLGYPAYFANLLGAAKLLGVCVLLAPGCARVKEWAYAGFGIVVLSACYSHLLSGDGLMAFEPLITFAALVTAYVSRPAERRFFHSTGATPGSDLGGVRFARSASREI
jgi:DoxX-like protein